MTQPGILRIWVYLAETPLLWLALTLAAFAVGDHVVSSFIYMCGKCRFCSSGRPVLCVEQGKALTTPPEGTPRVKDRAGKPLGIFSGCGVMAEYATLSVDNVVKIDSKIPLDRAALVLGGGIGLRVVLSRTLRLVADATAGSAVRPVHITDDGRRVSSASGLVLGAGGGVLAAF